MRVIMHEEHEMCLECKKLRKVFVKHFHYKRFNCNVTIATPFVPLNLFKAVNSLDKYWRLLIIY